MQLTKQQIIDMLATDQRAVARAILVLYERQTRDEQHAGDTRYANNRGVRPCHARMLSSMAEFFKRNKYLTPNQINYWRVKDRTGAMRIGIYAGQLLEAAAEKAAVKAEIQNAFAKAGFPPNNSYKNLSVADLQEKNRLEYEVGMVMDSDDHVMVGKAQAELDDFMKKLQTKCNA